MDRQFSTIYAKFATAHRERNYNEMIKIMATFECETIAEKFIEHHVFMFRATFDCVRRCAKEPAASDVANFVQQFVMVLSAKAKYNGCQEFLDALNMLAQPEHLNANPSVLTIAAVADGPNMMQSMRMISQILRTSDDRGTNADGRKAIVLALTKSALIFFKLEHEMNGDRFVETKHYLKCCMNLDFLRSDKYSGDYVQCFKIMETYVMAWENGASNWQKNMDEVLSLVNAAPKSLRATVVQDIAVTLAELIQISKKNLHSLLHANQIRTIFKLMLKLTEILRHTNYDKVFCTWCKGNVGRHEVDVIAGIATEVYKSAIEKKMVLDVQVCEAFGKIFALNLMTLSQLECSLANVVQTKQVQEIRLITRLCSTKEKVKYAVPMYVHICQNFADIQLTKVKSQVEEIYMLRFLYDMVKLAENWSEVIHVGYCIMAYTLVADNPNKKVLNSIIYEVSKIQLRHKDTIPFQTPYDYYLATSKGNVSIFRLNFPKNVSIVELLLTYVEINGCYGVPGLEEFNNKCVNQLMMLAKKQEPIRCLRFIYHLEKFNLETIADSCERQLKILRASADSHDENHKHAVSLLVGAFDLAIYIDRVTETIKKNTGLSLMDEFNSNNRPTVFNEQTLAFEREQAQLLFNAKKRLESFLEFYLALDETARSVYEDESRYLLRALKDIARNFLCRDYERETLESYVALYRLARVVDDQFGMINACAHFAEHSLTFRERFQHKHGLELSAMLDKCYVHLVQNIQNIKELSIRKQKEIFYCMLNIALYHFADNRIDDGKKIMQFVKIQMVERNIQYGVVEMKYFSVLFTMITKYEQPSRFSAIEFGEYLIRKIRNTICNLPAEDSINIPLIIFSAVPAIVTFSLNRYETSSAVSESLLQTVLKFSIRSGYVRRSLNTLILIGMYELYQEKWQMSEKRLVFLEQMCQISKGNEVTNSADSKLSLDSTVNTIDCTDPIRRDASISVRCLSPYKTITNNVESHMCRYLQTSHMKDCSCDICFNAYNRFILFQIGTLYTRITYLNNTDEQTKQSIQTEIYDYWSTHLKRSEAFESSDSFYIGQARMLMWCAHIQWKFEKNREQAKIMLLESVEKLRNVRKYDRAMEHDLLGQIELLNNEMMVSKATKSGSQLSTLNHKKSFIDKESPPKQLKTQPVVATKPQRAAAVKKVVRPIINLFEETIPELRVKPATFQIHDDESPDTEASKKPTKKPTNNRKARSQKNIISDETSVVDLTTPPSKTESSVVEASPEPLKQQPAVKPMGRPNRVKCVATSNNVEEKLTQPTRTTRRGKIEIENTSVTRTPRTRRERK